MIDDQVYLQEGDIDNKAFAEAASQLQQKIEYSDSQTRETNQKLESLEKENQQLAA